MTNPPVPETDTGGQVENTKAIEQTVVKELGKMPPKLREKGGLELCRDLLLKQFMAAETRPKRLFNKNTGPCEVVTRCIRTDACPVLEGQGDGLRSNPEAQNLSPSKRRW